MRVIDLESVTAFVAFDLDGAKSAGGTRLAPDVTREEVMLLARAMTYKFAVLRQEVGGAKAAIVADEAGRDAAIERYCSEIRPMVERGEFLTSSDLGTRTEDFSGLPGYKESAVMHAEVDGVLVDAVVTGLGVVAAADAALGGLDGRRLAIEGFGKIGGAAVAEAARRGGRVVALSTLHGCVISETGLDVGGLFELRASVGDRCVEHLGLPVLPASALYTAEADVLVPGARTGVIDAERARGVNALVISPAANVPYTSLGLAELRTRGIVALADFVCSAGAAIGYLGELAGDVGTVLAARTLVDRKITELTEASMVHPAGAFTGACEMAEEFLRSWRDPGGMPDGPPLVVE